MVTQHTPHADTCKSATGPRLGVHEARRAILPIIDLVAVWPRSITASGSRARG
jgi:hypothetical protein